jgi:hypothetical protein
MLFIVSSMVSERFWTANMSISSEESVLSRLM